MSPRQEARSEATKAKIAAGRRRYFADLKAETQR